MGQPVTRLAALMISDRNDQLPEPDADHDDQPGDHPDHVHTQEGQQQPLEQRISLVIH
jgi:hypothetical protein